MFGQSVFKDFQSKNNNPFNNVFEGTTVFNGRFFGTTQPVAEPPVQEPPVQEPPVQEPPVQEPPVQEPPVQEPPVQEPPIMKFDALNISLARSNTEMFNNGLGYVQQDMKVLPGSTVFFNVVMRDMSKVWQNETISQDFIQNPGDYQLLKSSSHVYLYGTGFENADFEISWDGGLSYIEGEAIPSYEKNEVNNYNFIMESIAEDKSGAYKGTWNNGVYTPAVSSNIELDVIWFNIPDDIAIEIMSDQDVWQNYLLKATFNDDVTFEINEDSTYSSVYDINGNVTGIDISII